MNRIEEILSFALVSVLLIVASGVLLALERVQEYLGFAVLIGVILLVILFRSEVVRVVQ